MNDQKKKWVESRKELAEKYFIFKSSILQYSEGDGGIISLLSDVQEFLNMSVDGSEQKEHYRELLNDIKSVLCQGEWKRQNNVYVDLQLTDEEIQVLLRNIEFENEDEVRIYDKIQAKRKALGLPKKKEG